MHIAFNKPPYTGNEDQYIHESLKSIQLSGNGQFSNKCQDWFREKLCCQSALLTTSCTHALEMAAMLLDLEPGDEIIMPSYTFPSTANAFVLQGARIVFIDIRPETMNMNASLLEDAITDKTRAIVPVHYAGVACEMDAIMAVAEKHGLVVIEDAAQGMMCSYRNRPLGTIGHMGTFSFHETKNYTSGGEGGLLIINDEKYTDRAEIIREKGTNRSLFFRGMVDKYSWVDIGSSYLMNDLSAAYLWGQLEKAGEISEDRLASWRRYSDLLSGLAQQGKIELQHIPDGMTHNAHMFYFKVEDLERRTDLLRWLKEKGITAIFHYVPLHTAPAGQIYGRFDGNDNYTTSESERLVRLPLYYGMEQEKIDYVVENLEQYFLANG